MKEISPKKNEPEIEKKCEIFMDVVGKLEQLKIKYMTEAKKLAEEMEK